MQTSWSNFPPNYRAHEVQAIRRAVSAGDSVSLVGLGGAGKSNLLGYLAQTQSAPELSFLLVDGNRISEPTPAALYALIAASLKEDGAANAVGPFEELSDLLARRLALSSSSLCLMLDLSLLFGRYPQLAENSILMGNLRALRDIHKYRLTYLIATRHLLAAQTELSELVSAHTMWLGPLSRSDAEWTVGLFLERHGLAWNRSEMDAAMQLSLGFPSVLRAVCEAHMAGAALDESALRLHPAVEKCVAEFWSDQPSAEEIKSSGLENAPLLLSRRGSSYDPAKLTAKEMLLIEYFQAHAEAVCAKDDLIRAVWPEDRVYERGVRDDSLAQLVRRLREKIETDPAVPKHILTVPGRGYRFFPDGAENI
jgi:hypothetical protein